MTQEEKELLKNSEQNFNNIQKSSKIVLMNDDEQIFFVTSHSNGNFLLSSDFFPITDLKFINGFKKLKFNQILKHIIHDINKIECYECPFKNKISNNEYSCSLINNDEIQKYKSLINFTFDKCPLKIYRKNNISKQPTKFTDL